MLAEKRKKSKSMTRKMEGKSKSEHIDLKIALYKFQDLTSVKDLANIFAESSNEKRN